MRHWIARAVFQDRSVRHDRECMSSALKHQRSRYRRHAFCTGSEPKYLFSMTRRNLLWSNRQVTPIPLGEKTLTKFDEQFTSSTSVPPHKFHDATNPTTGQVESASRGDPHAHALCTSGGHDNFALRMESQGLSIRKNAKAMARSELEATERDARCALFFQDQLFKIAVRGYQILARDAVNQAVTESAEIYGVVMQSLKLFRVDMRNEWKIMRKEGAQVIGCEVLEAPRGETSHMLHEHQVLLQA